MGEHGTWFDYLNRFSWWRDLEVGAQQAFGRSWRWQVFGVNEFSLTHVLLMLLVVLVIIAGAIAFYAGFKSSEGGVVPPRKMTFRHFFEYLTESVYGMAEGALGEERAPKFLPLVGALWLFILFSNLIGLIPGFIAPTDTLKTNVGIALLVFLLTHYYGVKEHGIAPLPKFFGFIVLAAALVGGGVAAYLYAGAPVFVVAIAGFLGFVAFAQAVPYFKHFLGPIWYLSWLMLPIELIGHIARPVSLSMRLMGNMIADHKVLIAFFALVPLLVPVPFMLLGILVCVLQAFVFCTLAMVYFGMAIEHEEEH